MLRNRRGRHEASHLTEPLDQCGASPVASAKGWLAYQGITPRGEYEDGIFLVRTDGSDDHQIVADLPGRQRHLDFSRDGRRLTFDQTTSEELNDGALDRAFGAFATEGGAASMRAVSRWVALLAALGLVLAACGGSDEPAGGDSATATTASATTASAARSPIAGVMGWIAYQSISDRGPDGVYLVRTDGSEDHEIATEVPGQRLHPDFSPDGKRLAFDQRTSDNDPDQVYVAAADGSGPRQLTKCQPPKCAGLWEPAWSLDGKRLAIATSYGFHPGLPSDRFGIGTIDLATGKVKAVVDHDYDTGQDHFPRWSPDGRRLVFWRDVEQKHEIAVFVVNVDGSAQRQLTKWDMQAGDADWSPDGKLIVFATFPLGNFQVVGHSELYTIRPDGTGLRRLTNYGPDGPRAAHPRWTPDGKGIIYVRTTQEGTPRHLYFLSADGKQDVPVLAAKRVYTHPILQPVS